MPGRMLRECLVEGAQVVLTTEGVERPLLGNKVLLGRLRGLRLQRPVEAFLSTVLLRLSRGDPFHSDTEL